MDSAVELDSGANEDSAVTDVAALDASGLDAAIRDAGRSDAGSRDTAIHDGATRDAAIRDAGRSDAGSRDATIHDGATRDAAARDAAARDASALDGGRADTGPWSCDPAEMPLPNAGLVEAPGSGGCSPGMARILPEGFCIDRFEGSLVLVQAGGSTVSWSPYHHPGARRARAVSLEGAVPQGYIDGVTAGAACAQAGKRLCTDDEWLRACRGSQRNIYPYGNTRMPGVCNDARAVHPAIELFPGDPHPYSHLQDPCLNQLPRSLALSGSHPGCVTPDGVFDMMGNLHEWTSNTHGAFRGGFYVDTRINGEGCLYVTTAHTRPYWDYSTGFRCCTD